MPASYQIEKSLGLVLSTAQGVLTGQDILTHRQRLRDDPNFDPSYNQLVDLRDVIEIDISVAEMSGIAGRSIYSERSRRAIVAGKDANFGMARMYELYGEANPDHLMVFRDMAEARRWLGLD
jgi:hypothetical protein